MHVAISLWMVLVARIQAPQLVPFALLYTFVIWIGSVQLGWHYVSDGLAGMVGMAAIWALAGLNRSCTGGEGGIRTHGGLAPTAVFKTAALNHSATSPEPAAPIARRAKLCKARDEPSWRARGSAR